MTKSTKTTIPAFAMAVLIAGVAALALPASTAVAQTKIKVGNIPGSTGFFIPSYVAMDKGFFKREGLDASWVKMGGKALVTAGMGGAIDFLPIPGGGSVALLKGAKLKFVVGQGIISQWAIVVHPDIKKVSDLKGKTIGFGRPGAAAYDEGELTLRRFFNLQVGRDYSVISFQDEPGRIAAMINGNIQGALLTFPHAAKVQKVGYRILIKTGEYLPRVGGTFWVTEDYLAKNRPTVKKFIRAIAKAEEFLKNNKAGSIEVIQSNFGISDPKEAEMIYNTIGGAYGPDVPHRLLVKLFEGRVAGLKSKGLWPKNKPLPDVEKFVARDLLTSTLREMGYYLQAPPLVEGRMK